MGVTARWVRSGGTDLLYLHLASTVRDEDIGHTSERLHAQVAHASHPLASTGCDIAMAHQVGATAVTMDHNQIY